MKAIGYTLAGNADVLREFSIEKPVPGPRDLLISVKAVSVNPVDYKIRASVTPEPGEMKVLGYDGAGIVEAVGADVTLFKPGDEVYYCGLHTRQGSNAEYQLVDERITGKKPSTLSFAEAAALPLTSLTAWELLFDRLRLPCGLKSQPGTLLVINGAGGVGSILIQLARRLTGLTIIATASRTASTAWVRDMGAHHVINHHEPLAQQIRSLGIDEVQYVAGLRGTLRQIEEIAEIIAPQGHLSLIDDGAFDIGPLKPKSVAVTWEMVFTRPLYATKDMIVQHQILDEVASLVDAGVLKTTLTTHMGKLSAETLRKAHQHVASSSMIGKVALDGI
ncbi:zinc-binding alcohol dehydrogenase family protein [Rahnella sp. AA]|uniref:zinc-binding alcohol dehydrogenase family protein n=1 Tax=Rahnella sp. AA TaxID=2057180 RepID=UPI000C33EF9B|nr:zinc-binding alcohol dehydrogenase family protein [Rahnella sp. AA]PKE28074.1 zinc-binding alcohol dehydrogenase family protein [Rahnella sp. AA]